MRIVFMGTPDIAATCLERLCAAGFAPVGVYTKPDMPKNRGMKLSMSEVKEAALAHGLPVFQPTTFKDDAVVEELRALAPDVIAVVAYGKILPQRVLDIPPLGCINIHASILPQLRGAGPVQWAILNGLTETGVTGMYMDAGMDTGDIIEIRRTPIDPDENAQSLLDRLADLGGGLLAELMARLAREAMEILQSQGIKAGLIRPISLWPFPYSAFDALTDKTKVVISTELSMGQMIQDVQLGVKGRFPVKLIHRTGGMLPTSIEIVDKTKKILEEVR